MRSKKRVLFFVFCLLFFDLLAGLHGVRRRFIGEPVEAAVLMRKLAAVGAARVGAALPETAQITRLDEPLNQILTPVDLQAPENRVNLLDELAHIYTRMRLARNETDVLVVRTTVLVIREQNTGELACARG